MIRTVVVASAAALAACLGTPTHHCAVHEDCPQLTCVEVAPGDRRCAVADVGCESGLAWASDAGDLAGECIEGSSALDWNPCFPQPAAIGRSDACTSNVCALEPRCCTLEWSDMCVNYADRLCGLSCGGIGAFVGENQTYVAEWTGSDFQAFWAEDVTGFTVQAAAWGDYDGDQRPDLATCDDGTIPGAKIRIFHNDGGEDLTRVKIADTNILCSDVDWVDLDSDGDQDVVASGAYQIEWVENDNGIWADTTDVVQDGFVASVDWADVDGDGKLDAAVARYEDSLRVLRNQGPTNFTLWHDSGDAASLPRYKSTSWGNVDAVGGVDLLIGGENFLRMHPNTDSNAFELGAPMLDLDDHDHPTALLVDVQEDDDLDIVAFALQGPLRVFRNDLETGTGGFTETPLFTSGTAPLSGGGQAGMMSVGDVDGDRHLDLVLCEVPDFCQLWVGHGDGTFTRTWDPGGTRAIFGAALTSDWR